MTIDQLAVLGGAAQFAQPLHVGRPNLGDRAALLSRIERVLDSGWFTNHGPMVQEFEERLASTLEVDHVVAVNNATLGLQIVMRAAGLTGEVIVPSFTFVATAHAVEWQGLDPVFADIDPATHVLDPASVEAMITPRTTGIVAVHTWGVPAQVEALTELAERRGLHLLFDAAHAMGCTHAGRPIGGNGRAEVFSFHATKYMNSFEGGAVATDDAELASLVRDMSNFGFAGYDRVRSVGTNAKMTEVCAAMGLTSLEEEPRIAAHNRAIWEVYERGLAGLDGVRLRRYHPAERNSHQYVVVEVDGAPLSRDEVVATLHLEGCFARRYFYPGVHRMEPYRSHMPQAPLWLTGTEALSSRVMTLPTGLAVTPETASTVAGLIVAAMEAAPSVRATLARIEVDDPAIGWIGTDRIAT